MCGIAGYIGFSDLPDSNLEVCLERMKRRGPNGHGLVKRAMDNEKVVYLLHSRLSVIDLDDRSSQPFSSGKKDLIFNGEIYNYIELGFKLRGEGVDLKTTGDTEVLFELLRHGGLDGLRECEGMWALAYYDGVNETLYLSRDRFGEKPLYFYQEEDGLYFGSEPKFIFALLGRTLPVNFEQVKRFLVNGYKSLYKQEATFFEGLQEIRPGTTMSIGHENITTQRYWDFHADRQNDQMTYEDATNAVRDALYKSMELRLRSDVPIAFCLSGGIDSNALISIAKHKLGHTVHGFTIMNTDSRYEEREMVDIAVRELGLEHTAIAVDGKNFIDDLRELVNYHDAPVYTISYFAQWQLMKEVRKNGYSVCVSGTGADEIFSGYYDHHNAYLHEMKILDDALYANALRNWEEHVKPIVRNPFLVDANYFIADPNSRDHIYLDSDKFKGMMKDEFSESFREIEFSDSLLRNRMLNELFAEAVPVILHEDDLNSMYYSIENRSPFLDKDLFELSLTIPTAHLVKNGRAKALLRDAVSDIAPKEVIYNPRKVGFNIPILDYFDVQFPENRSFLMSESPIYDIIDRSSVERVAMKGRLENSFSKFLFSFLSTMLFLEEYS